MGLPLEKVKETKLWFDTQPEPWHYCNICGGCFLVFGEIPADAHIVCDECGVDNG